MTFDSAGTALHRHRRSGRGLSRRIPPSPAQAPELFFKSDEAHIRCAGLGRERQPDCRLRRHRPGLPHQPAGQRLCAFEAPRREITVDCRGRQRNHLRGQRGRQDPQSAAAAARAGSRLGDHHHGAARLVMQAANASTSVPEGTEIYALDEGPGAAQALVRQGRDRLRAGRRPDGLLALTGNRGRIFRIQDDGSYADVAHLDAQQGLSLAGPGLPRTAAFSSAPATPASCFVRWAPSDNSTNTPATCWMPARWRALAASRSSPARPDYELLTRTGNVEQPVRGWTDWQPLKDGIGGLARRALSAVEGGAACGRRAWAAWA